MKFSSKPELLSKCLIQVAFVVSLMIAIMQGGFFDHIEVDIGLSHYAEKTPQWVPKDWLPYLSMPCNAMVNIGYILVGSYWLATIKMTDYSYFFCVFFWFAILYGPVQFYRIAIQSVRSAVLDQWMTLPFFAWAYQWTCDKLNPNIRSPYITIAASLTSFVLAIFIPNGFIIALFVHILLLLTSSVRVLIQFGDQRSTTYFVLGLLSLSGFVILKLFDLELAQLCPKLFTVLSGHFWSKICDILQIHFCAKFAMSVENVKSKKF